MVSPSVEATRNFKDFMRLYNELTESCFNFCVAELGSRSLTDVEENCVAKCAEKNIRLNHKTMAVFMDLQPAMLEKRRLEAEEAFAKMDAAAPPEATDQAQAGPQSSPLPSSTS